MKSFYKWILILQVYLFGYACMVMYIKIKGFEWYHVLLLIGGLIITSPALIWWVQYFDKLFSEKETD
jgi:hypothetical protein